MRHLGKKAIVLTIVIIVGLAFGLYSYPCFSSHEYFNEFPDEWKIISTGHTSDDIFESYQVALSGDFLGSGEIVTIACYHHRRPGIYVNYQDGGTWNRYPLHHLFDLDNEDGWPVKGIVSADFDSDGLPEIITAMDSVLYPPTHLKSGSTKPFPGVVYIDPNEPTINPQPLVWGAWGENITSTSIANCIPTPIDPKFRSPTNNKMDIIVPTMTKVASGDGARVFMLEQPEKGFGAVNFTYLTEDILGTFPYNDDPFYVHRFYVKHGVDVGELVWRPSDLLGATGAFASSAIPIDYDHDGNMDLIVGGAYTHGEEYVCARATVYHRLASTLEHKYLFEEAQTFLIPDAIFADGKAANLDGNPTNGKESIVFGYSSNNTDNYPYSGVLTLMPNGVGFDLGGISYTSEGLYPYRRIYSRLVVMDCNKDGYDDAIIYCEDYYSWELSYGDLVLFLNMRGTSNVTFGLDPGQYRLLFNNEGITWGVYAQQLDADSDLEITISSMQLIPHWCPFRQGVKYAYGLDVVELFD